MTRTAGEVMLELEYPKAFASAFAPTLAKHGKRFKYVHITGALEERDQNKPMWMKSTVRKTKVCDLQRKRPSPDSCNSC
jgi:hypothetical protein